MKTNRRSFLQTSALSAGFLGVLPAMAAVSAKPPSFLTKKPTMRLGLVTYNLAQDWDIETIIKNCQAAQFDGVELRTSHAHKVEVNLSKPERTTVRERFQNSDVQLMGLGSAFEYHTPDQAKLKQDIAATKEYIVLAHDVGATGVKVRPNGLPKEVSTEKTLDQIGRSLKELGDFGDGLGIKIRLEVHG
jgi:sugar phosphate isomerase/epimerase